MSHSHEIEDSALTFSRILNTAARLPGVRIDRARYLRSSLRRYCTEDQIEQAISESPAVAGVPPKVVKAMAKTSITYETTKVTGLSAAAGIPGGFALLGTVPADLVQYTSHMLRIAQKLAYIYSWPDLFAVGDGDMDEATEGILTLFIGVMVGVQMAQGGVNKVASMMAAQVLKKLPEKALTKGAVYPIVKSVAKVLGVQMTKKVFASGVAKAIPVAGAVLSGGLTLGTFLPMSKRLQKHLAGPGPTKPGSHHETVAEDEDLDVVDAELVYVSDADELAEHEASASSPVETGHTAGQVDAS